MGGDAAGVSSGASNKVEALRGNLILASPSGFRSGPVSWLDLGTFAPWAAFGLAPQMQGSTLGWRKAARHLGCACALPTAKISQVHLRLAHGLGGRNPCVFLYRYGRRSGDDHTGCWPDRTTGAQSVTFDGRVHTLAWATVRRRGFLHCRACVREMQVFLLLGASSRTTGLHDRAGEFCRGRVSTRRIAS